MISMFGVISAAPSKCWHSSRRSGRSPALDTSTWVGAASGTRTEAIDELARSAPYASLGLDGARSAHRWTGGLFPRRPAEADPSRDPGGRALREYRNSL